ncbi:MAG: ABC transporter ATP-binding protein [Firmicutes bacterium]|nr:ABC transporter ATP-binding protein [Bacillota bacterium]
MQNNNNIAHRHCIEVKDITKKYGRKTILQGSSFYADKSEMISLIGRNGCGKSTLIKIIAGIIPPLSGSIHYFSQDMLKKKSLFPKICGYVPQDNPLLEKLTVKDNMALWMGHPGKIPQNTVDVFELAPLLKTPVSKLSGGMKRRVSIACALVNTPSVLIMDEPVSAQDLHYRKKIHSVMELYLKSGGIIILATHDTDEIAMSTRCYYMDKGILNLVEDRSEKNIKSLFV